MKLLFTFLLLTSSTAHANFFGCGYGSMEKSLRCHVETSYTNEAGNSVVYARQEFSLNGRFQNSASFDLGSLKGRATYDISGRGSELEFNFTRAVSGVVVGPQQVEFPEGCFEERPSITSSGSFTVAGSVRNLSIRCVAISEFVQD